MQRFLIAIKCGTCIIKCEIVSMTISIYHFTQYLAFPLYLIHYLHYLLCQDALQANQGLARRIIQTFEFNDDTDKEMVRK